MLMEAQTTFDFFGQMEKLRRETQNFPGFLIDENPLLPSFFTRK